MHLARAAGGEMDAGMTLARLARRGILRRSGNRQFTFRQPFVRDALEVRIPAGERHRLHRAVLDHLHGGERTQAVLARVVRHGSACGARAEVLVAAEQFADEAARRHQYLDADRYLSIALTNVDPADERARASLLAARGRARYRIENFVAAREDLGAARAIALASGDERLAAEMFLEEATALDWMTSYVESSALVEQAIPLVERLGDRTLATRCLMARGRSAWRAERVPEAIELLEAAAKAADYETQVISLLLLPCALVTVGRLDEAETRFAEVIEICRQAGDLSHLGFALTNRMWLWQARSEQAKALDDLREAIRLARLLGQPYAEWISTFNLAELLHFQNSADALPLARRALELHWRYGGRHHDPPLLVARSELAHGNRDEVRRLLSEIARRSKPDEASPSARAFLRMLELVLDEDAPRSAWAEIVEEAQVFQPLEHMEILYWRARTALERDLVEEAQGTLAVMEERLSQSPTWQDRVQQLRDSSSIKQR